MPETTMPAAPPPVASAAAATTETAELRWRHPQGMIGLSVVNFLLRIITLGIYHFWGKTEVRRRIWAGIRLNGDPLSYTGTGKELFLGFLVVFGVIVVPTLLVSFGAVLWLGPDSPWVGVFQLLLYVVFFYLIGVAIHRAQRYRLTRTRWRGIGGGMEGSAWSYATTHFWTALLIPLTLGWIVPWRSTRLQGLLVRDMRFGNRPFGFDAQSGPLYPRFVGLWVGGVLCYIGLIGSVALIMWPSIIAAQEKGLPYIPGGIEIALVVASFLVFSLIYALVSAWYRAGLMNHFAAHTTYEGARFSGTATAPSLIWLSLTNFLMVLLTLGLLTPVAQARSARYFVEHLALDGELPVGAIMQGAEDTSRRGEGLAQAFDVDAF